MTDKQIVKLLKARFELATKNKTNMVYVTPKQRECAIRFLDNVQNIIDMKNVKLYCPKCNSKKHISWQSDFTFDDLGRDGNGTVYFYECLKCGTQIEISIPEDEEESDSLS